MPRNALNGIHRVEKKLSGGSVKKYHYVFRGGPQFWNSNSHYKVGSADYLTAFLEASKPNLLRPSSKATNEKSTTTVLNRYRESIHFTKLADRTRKDYNKFLNSFECEFGDDPIKLFEELESISEIRV